MRPIGFSTGALAFGNFRVALNELRDTDTKAVELSALRDHEVGPLMEALPTLDLACYSYVSVHVPSAFRTLTESQVAMLLTPCIDFDIPVVIHPDVIRETKWWQPFRSLLCIENMDKRKRIGRTANELDHFFSILPDATFCLDIGHVCQIDSTMSEARRMLRRFGERLRQLHISEIDAQGHHHKVTLATILATHSIASLIRPQVPAIIESQIPPKDMAKELTAVKQALNPSLVADWECLDWGALA